MIRFRRFLLLAVTLWVSTAELVIGAGMPVYNSGNYNYTDRKPSQGESTVSFLSMTGADTYSETFDLTKSGYDSSKMRITSLRVTFAFADDGDSSDECVHVSLNGETWAATEGQEIDGTVHNAPFNYDYYHQAWEMSDHAAALFLKKIQNGRMPFTVKATVGDAYLKLALVEATVVSSSPVPETGSTIALITLSFAAFVYSKRRKAFPNTSAS